MKMTQQKITFHKCFSFLHGKTEASIPLLPERLLVDGDNSDPLMLEGKNLNPNISSIFSKQQCSQLPSGLT
jgi:hypothetical protein